MSDVQKEKIYELDMMVKNLQPAVARISERDIRSFNASIGANYQRFCDVKQKTFNSPEELKNAYFAGWHNRVLFLKERSKTMEYYTNLPENQEYRVFILYNENITIHNYIHLFLERSFYKYYREYSRNKPPLEEILWIGSNDRVLGIGVTPRYRNGYWENDKSEVRKTLFEYWTIGHILHTGFLEAGKNNRIMFNGLDNLLNFITEFVAKFSCSKYELGLMERYSEYVRAHHSPPTVPLLIPQFRYGGLEKSHQYRLDFLIINPTTQKRYGFELSPYSTHSNFENYEKDNQKRLDFQNKHDIVCNTLTDAQLRDSDKMFLQIEVFLQPKQKDNEVLALSSERLTHLYKEHMMDKQGS